MMTRKLIGTLSAILTLVVLATSSTGAAMNPKRTAQLTFSQAIRVPGVSLPAGTYRFELADPDHVTNLVQVWSGDGKKLYFTGLTIIVERPARMPRNQNIVFGEGTPKNPVPVKTWYPRDEHFGRQFIY